jgi:hypothetical protein
LLDRGATGRNNAAGCADADQSEPNMTVRTGGRPSRKAMLGLALAAALVCFAARPPHLHETSEAHTHAAGVIPAALAVALGAVAVLGATRRRWRRAAVASLIALLTVFAFETALHSVHHLGEAGADSSCPVVGATLHLSGACAPVTDIGVPAHTGERAADPGPTWLVPFQPIQPREGRAPPAPALA